MMRESYRKLYERQAAFYKRHSRAKTALILGNYALTALVFFAYALLCLFVFLVHSPERTQGDFVRIFCVPLLCLLAVSSLRNLVDRKRPYETGAIVPVIVKRKKGHSFPSRHVSSAFVIGTVLLSYCIWAGVGVLIAGALLGYIRFAAGIHYPSDLFAGAAIGVLFGLIAFI